MPWTYTTDDNPGGKAKFGWDGDQITVCDEQSDGYGVRARVMNSQGATLMMLQDPNSTDGCYTGSRNITDGIGVRVEVCLYKGGIYTYFCRISDWGVS
ncbi:hypothetical protein [Streptomyces sp. NPDC056527]|uniref:hypothetical protein n=1 Tax=Streptomyces sp. NPDC056527 TaxID=3345853 RepID=UPI0036886725